MDNGKMMMLAGNIYEFFKSKQREILREYIDPPPLYEKSPGNYVGAVDEVMQEWFMDFLPRLVPCDVISEEINHPWHTRPDRFWVIDPLDGTHNHSAKMFFGHQLALIEDGVLAFSAIYLPLEEQATWDGFFFAAKCEGAWQHVPQGLRLLCARRQKNLKKAHLLLEGPSRGLRKQEFPNRVALEAERNHNGLSYAYSATRLAMGGLRPLGVDALIGYKGCPWDTLPGILLFEEAGGFMVTGWDGSPWSLENCGNLIFAATEQLLCQILALNMD